MPSIPGSFNGGIPPNIVWDENNPPPKYSCSNGITHAPGCDGRCPDPGYMKEYDVEMINEQREWLRVGMHPNEIVIGSPPFDLELRPTILADFLHEKGVIDSEEFNEYFVRARAERMKKIRLENQEQAKRMKFGLPPKPQMFGPGGQPL